MSKFQCQRCQREAEVKVHVEMVRRIEQGTVILYRQRPCEACGAEMVCQSQREA